MAKIVFPGEVNGGESIAKNSLSVSFGDLVALKSGYVDVAAAGDKIEGIAVETTTFDADNQTVKKAKVQYLRTSDDTEFELSVAGGTIAQANVGSTYDVTGGSADATTVGTGTQLRLRKVLTSTKGIFVRAK
jgi:hypothetical protein